MQDLIGRTLGSYRITEQLGRGGMATVYKAYHPVLDRYVAVKVLPRYFTHDTTFFERFLQEAQAVARLRHHNIMQVYDFGREGDIPYLVMEYLPGGTLQDRLGQPLPLDEALRITRQVAEALGYAHKQGIIHRDVKPSNVLLTKEGDAVLSDFGIAKIVESLVTLTKTGVGVGTPEYMAPEQGQGLPVDGRSDLYSLGVMLYEMTTGQAPYSAETPLAVVLKHINDPLPLPRRVNPAIPEAVERIILTCLAKSPADRYQTGADLVQAIDRVMKPGLGAVEARTEAEVTLVPPTPPVTPPVARPPTPAPPPVTPPAAQAPTMPETPPPVAKPPTPTPPPVTPPPAAYPTPPVAMKPPPSYPPTPPVAGPPTPPPARPSMFPGRSGVLVWVLAGALLLAILGLAVLGGFALRGRVGEKATATPTVAATLVVVARTPSPTLPAPSAPPPAPTATPLAPTATPLAPTATRLSPTATPLPPTATPVPPPTATTAVVAATSTPRPAPATFSGRIVYTNFRGPSRYGDFEVMLMDVPGGTPRKIADRGSEPTFSPDGSRILFYSWNDNGFFTMRLDGSDRRRVSSSTEDAYPAWSPDGKRIAFSLFEKYFNVWVMNADGSGRTKIIEGCEQPSWSPDGSRIVCKGCIGANCGLLMANADGSNKRLISDNANDSSPAWSPGGGYILFTSNRSENLDVWIMRADGTGIQQLTTNPTSDGAATWSPDGNFIFFRSDRDGSWGIYVMRDDGSNQSKVVSANVSERWWWERISVTR